MTHAHCVLLGYYNSVDFPLWFDRKSFREFCQLPEMKLYLFWPNSYNLSGCKTHAWILPIFKIYYSSCFNSIFLLINLFSLLFRSLNWNIYDLNFSCVSIISRAVSNFYGTENEILAGFGPVGNTENNWGQYEQLLRSVL